ncbi:substrate-binding domain-containing protein [Mycoplasma crocodyli]|uniref:46 kDa surface antigen (P46) n=1 Tax=Mycoplasma crocodyli (strain ATCC 51981 / MP145) TaxID=512564 RepID=D5E504_MYCCM|nr:sugar-binding protein [Mycoplasma crocodyli]ADE19371.1 46 kDa surface antigen (p46) [Mycoplasma crocodyli MP145]
MKTKKLLIGLGAMTALAALSVAAISCENKTNKDTQTTTPVTAESPRIAISDPDNPRWLKAQKELLAAFDTHKVGAVSSIVKDQPAQNAFIDAAVAGGTKGLIIGAVDGSAVAGSVNGAATKGVKVVAYDRLIKGTDKYNWYTTFDNSKVGELQGLYLLSSIYGQIAKPFATEKEAVEYAKAHNLAAESFVYSLAGSPTDNNAPLFYKGAKKVVDAVMAVDKNLKYARAEKESFETAAVDNWDYSKAQASMSAFLTSFANKDKLVGVISPNDGMANAAIASLKGAQIDVKKVSITGQDFNADAIKNIKSGEQLMTIYKPDSSLAKVAVAILKTIMDDANKTKSPAEIFAIVKELLPAELKGIVTLDSEQYKSTDTHKINTIILVPTVVTKTNIAEFEGK